eukprot:gene12110-18714_t
MPLVRRVASGSSEQRSSSPSCFGRSAVPSTPRPRAEARPSSPCRRHAVHQCPNGRPPGPATPAPLDLTPARRCSHSGSVRRGPRDAKSLALSETSIAVPSSTRSRVRSSPAADDVNADGTPCPIVVIDVHDAPDTYASPSLTGSPPYCRVKPPAVLLFDTGRTHVSGGIQLLPRKSENTPSPGRAGSAGSVAREETDDAEAEIDKRLESLTGLASALQAKSSTDTHRRSQLRSALDALTRQSDAMDGQLRELMASTAAAATPEHPRNTPPAPAGSPREPAGSEPAQPARISVITDAISQYIRTGSLVRSGAGGGRSLTPGGTLTTPHGHDFPYWNTAGRACSHGCPDDDDEDAALLVRSGARGCQSLTPGGTLETPWGHTARDFPRRKTAGHACSPATGSSDDGDEDAASLARSGAGGMRSLTPFGHDFHRRKPSPATGCSDADGDAAAGGRAPVGVRAVTPPRRPAAEPGRETPMPTPSQELFPPPKTSKQQRAPSTTTTPSPAAAAPKKSPKTQPRLKPTRGGSAVCHPPEADSVDFPCFDVDPLAAVMRPAVAWNRAAQPPKPRRSPGQPPGAAEGGMLRGPPPPRSASCATHGKWGLPVVDYPFKQGTPGGSESVATSSPTPRRQDPFFPKASSRVASPSVTPLKPTGEPLRECLWHQDRTVALGSWDPLDTVSPARSGFGLSSPGKPAATGSALFKRKRQLSKRRGSAAGVYPLKPLAPSNRAAAACAARPFDPPSRPYAARSDHF